MPPKGHSKISDDSLELDLSDLEQALLEDSVGNEKPKPNQMMKSSVKSAAPLSVGARNLM